MQRSIKVSEICERFDLTYCGPNLSINGLNLCNRDSVYGNVLTYVINEGYVEAIQSNSAIVGIIIREQDMSLYQDIEKGRKMCFVLCDEPEKTFYDIHDYLYFETDFYDKFEFETQIGENCSIHFSAIVENGVIIENNVTIGANSVVKKGTVIKNGCTIGCNTTIGSEGFQILRVGNENRKVIHCGGVWIEENAYVGDNTAVCNSLFEGYSYVGKNAKIDNLVHIGHNGFVDDNAVVAAGVISCGNSVVENGAWIGGNSSVLNRMTVGSYSKIGIGSVVTRDVSSDSLAYGVPAKVKIIFGGGRNLGVRVLRWLCEQSWIEIIAVCPVPKEYDLEAADEMRLLIYEKGLSEYSLDEIKNMKFDIGLSINYHRIIPTEILDLCEKGFYNIHHSYNLRLKGRNITTHAILNARKESIFYHGTTLHKMIPELDAGPIVASSVCEISEDDTAYTLFRKVEELAMELVIKWLPRIAFEKVYMYLPPVEGVHCYRYRDLPTKEIKYEQLNSDEIYDCVRAFDFPGYDPAYIMKNNVKQFLVIKKRAEFTREIYIKGKRYYTT